MSFFQVQNIQDHSMSLSRGVRIPSPSVYQTAPLVGPSHSRSDSLPAEAYLNHTPSPPTVSPLLTRKVHDPHQNTVLHGSHLLLTPASGTGTLQDPLGEYKPTDLDWNQNKAYPEGPRASMVW